MNLFHPPRPAAWLALLALAALAVPALPVATSAHSNSLPPPGDAPLMTPTPIRSPTPTVTGTLPTATPTRTATATPACAAWERVTSPNLSAFNNYLYGIAAGGGNVWAVGYIRVLPTNYDETLILRWDGSAWQQVPSPSPLDYNHLEAVAVDPATGEAWAVGAAYAASGTPAPFLLHWDGLAWSLETAPSTGSTYLHGVAVAASGDVWAVGETWELGNPDTYTVRRVNGVWSRVPSPRGPFSWLNILQGVSFAAPVDGWAVGYYATALGNAALVLHWDGSAWSVIPLGIPQYIDQLYGVAALPGSAIAVGFRGTDPLILHCDPAYCSPQDAASWPGMGVLRGVAAGSPSDIWAVGDFHNGNDHLAGVQHWDGSAWTTSLTPRLPGDNPLYAVASVGSRDVWAAGTQGDQRYLTLTLHFPAACTTVTPSVTPTVPTPTATATGWIQATIPATRPIFSPTPLSTPCMLTFTDVDPGNPFYVYIRCLACRQIVSGYNDGTFRWGNSVTRGQAAKILALVTGYADPIPSNQQTFADVPPSNLFWQGIERLALHGVINGYACGGPGEPCDGQNRPYFRGTGNVTRGQLSKMDAQAAVLIDPIPSERQTFADVPPSNPFRLWIERIALYGVISGYQCGGPGEPCDGQTRPYFRWGGAVTRGQTAKIAASTFYPGCQTPLRR